MKSSIHDKLIDGCGFICPKDPTLAADALVKSYKGLLPCELEAEVKKHLKICERCHRDFESLAELDLEMLLVASDDQQLRLFQPTTSHAEECLLATWQRLERFAKGQSKDEVIGDEDLEKHIGKCVYCRRRSIIINRRLKFGDDLPLAYRLADLSAPVRESLETASASIWAILSDQEEPVRMAAQGEICVLTRRLSQDGRLDIRFYGDLLDLQFNPPSRWSGRSVLLVSRAGSEIRVKLSGDGVGLRASTPPGDYFIVADRKEKDCFVVSLCDDICRPR